MSNDNDTNQQESDSMDRLLKSLERSLRSKAYTLEQCARAYYRRHGCWPDVSDIDAEREQEQANQTPKPNTEDQ